LKYFGIVIVVLALLVAIFPQFTTCESQGKYITMASGATTPMKCSWTAKAELAVGVPLFAVGAMMAFNRRKENFLSLSVLGVILGVAVLLLPTSLIGVCSSNMLCNTVMKPTLLAAGGLVTTISLGGLWVSIGAKRSMYEFNQAGHKEYPGK
jgi:hypothetical protein